MYFKALGKAYCMVCSDLGQTESGMHILIDLIRLLMLLVIMASYVATHTRCFMFISRKHPVWLGDHNTINN